MSKVKLALVGASGRLGQSVLSVLAEYQQFELVAALVSPNSKFLASLCPNSKLKYSADIKAGLASADLVIDFSSPLISTEILKIAANNHTPCLIATTGHSADQVKQIEQLAKSLPVALCPNTSIGIYATGKIAKLSQEILGPSFDIEILELHRKHKKDAPSGTALKLGKMLADDFVFDRANKTKLRQDGEIGFASIRGGDLIGEHTVYFIGASERIEITHRVSDRAVFARGALTLADKLISKENGLYSLDSLFASGN